MLTYIFREVITSGDKFSEDLDFSLLADDPGFSFQPYLEAIITEFNSQGMQVSIRERAKTLKSHVESALLKSETIWKELVLDGILRFLLVL